MAPMHRVPKRIVCLTPETVDVLYRLGEQHRIAGISGFTVHPPEARREKPKVSAFTTAKLDRILALRPDLVLAFSDLQADLVAGLVRRGVAVHAFNQRSVEGILDMVATLGRLVDAGDRAEALVAELRDGIERTQAAAARLPQRPAVYFEEWDEPMICGIRWVSELVAIAGGRDVFAERARAGEAASRIVGPADVVDVDPDIIIGSWCGRKFRPDRVAARTGLGDVTAVRTGRLHEVKSADILQPGPVALTRGLDQLFRLMARPGSANG
jgi:iron complex transport system substrate-binding protein